MSEESNRQVGSIVPTIFIGLGGTGSKIVDRIAMRASRLPNWETHLRPLNSFITIDTNELDQKALRNVPGGNRINISSFDKVNALTGFRKSEDAKVKQFIDEGYKPRPGN